MDLAFRMPTARSAAMNGYAIPPIASARRKKSNFGATWPAAPATNGSHGESAKYGRDVKLAT
jgi:hypothetical protein